jgi:hypothetical protein
MTTVPDPDIPTSNSLWRLLVGGLLVIIILALGIAAWITLDGNAETDPQSFFTIGTASLTGLLGLFINKP